MKDSEFIELLNLYLDHEISATDAVRLEGEVQNNAARRRVYQQYCRMQKACKMLTADFQAEPTETTDRKVVAFAPAVAQSSRRSGLYAMGGLAAAACLAVILIGRGRPDAEVSGLQANQAPIAREVAASIPAPVASAPQHAVAVDAVPARSSRGQTMLASDSRLLTSNSQAEAMLVSAMQQGNDQFAWLRTAQPAPLRQQRVAVEELRFDVQPASLRPEGRALGSRPSTGEPITEMNALRFVK